MKVIVTAHAKERFVARFKFRFHKDVLHGRNLPIFMGDLFRKGIDADFHFRMNVGKYNQLCCKHGYRFRLKQYIPMLRPLRNLRLLTLSSTQ